MCQRSREVADKYISAMMIAKQGLLNSVCLLVPSLATSPARGRKEKYGLAARLGETSIIRHSVGLTIDVRLQRLSDYPVLHSTVKHGDCISEYGRIRENVGLQRMLDYGGSTVACSVSALMYTK